MNILFFLLSFIFIVFVGCSSNKPVNALKPKKTINEKFLKNDCIKKSNALSCAKLAYHYQGKGEALLAYRYYEKGCQLKDESACYNMRSRNPRSIYFKKVDSVMNFYSKNIVNCHAKTKGGIPTYSSTQLKEKWHRANIHIHISPEGKADRVNVSTALSEEFKICAVNEVKKIQFPKPRLVNPTYTYNFTIKAME